LCINFDVRDQKINPEIVKLRIIKKYILPVVLLAVILVFQILKPELSAIRLFFQYVLYFNLAKILLFDFNPNSALAKFALRADVN
jgi:hypothetical protein